MLTDNPTKHKEEMKKDQHAESKESWGWSDVHYVAIGVVVITIIISLFDFHPDLNIWLLEILRNLVISASISFTIFVFSIVLRLNKVILHWKFLLKTTIMYAFSGFLGGLLAWGINDLLFGFNITHPWFYFILTSSLAVIFGFIVYGYITAQVKLERTVKRLAEKEVAEQRLQNLKTKAELESLRARVDPHFFFNTLNSIASLIQDDPDKAEEIVQRLSHLFRYSLDTSNSEWVPLSRELEFLEEYLEIEKVRLADRLTYSIDVDPELMNFQLPGMLLQPLVENSIKHGISHTRNGGEIVISGTKELDNCILHIRDNGIGFNRESNREGFGLYGVRERLKLLYDEAVDLEIDTSAGVSITIRLPMDT